MPRTRCTRSETMEPFPEVPTVVAALDEEVDIIVKGGNYGWNLREGFHCFNAKDALHPQEDCAKVGAMGEPLLDPALEYKNINGHLRDPQALGISITGGYVYRGKALPQLAGK